MKQKRYRDKMRSLELCPYCKRGQLGINRWTGKLYHRCKRCRIRAARRIGMIRAEKRKENRINNRNENI